MNIPPVVLIVIALQIIEVLLVIRLTRRIVKLQHRLAILILENAQLKLRKRKVN